MAHHIVVDEIREGNSLNVDFLIARGQHRWHNRFAQPIGFPSACSIVHEIEWVDTLKVAYFLLRHFWVYSIQVQVSYRMNVPAEWTATKVIDGV